ncbi:MAG: type II toxin-antitoxin system Phd/YefM family antitoxin [Candidatus Marinimicrobia bacterium]|nr:type II toxin-antitoxin system Phd/YefM family antitoxin [Candidatus Neomarinimicrobiota bacterium]
MVQKHWQLQEAKNKFSHVVEQAEHIGPQFVTKHGKESVVVLSAKFYRKLLRPKKNIVKFFQESPLNELNLDTERIKEQARSIDL